MTFYLEFHPSVQEALLQNKPIVALESTLISHGLPYPDNLQTALKAEQILREQGVVPATIGIIDGKIKVGMTEEEIHFLAMHPEKIIKTSKKDIPFIVSQNLCGATTVCATMYIASLANIKIMATGGIGGVHRNFSETLDISADLEELATTDVAVVCSGIKSILDIEATLEYLATKSVLVLGYQTAFLPEFYTIPERFKVDYHIDTPKEVARFLMTKMRMNIKSGSLITNPIPKEFALDTLEMDHAIKQALIDADIAGIKGKAVTPYLLDKVATLTEGKSKTSNIELILNNTRLAGEIAISLSFTDL